ncbi:hypothetical protein LCGC14_1416320 [marine sediment metagenome]|uniref:Uncharacterized protein n=1 Tax=marine sediment metagenome TaxID=412755 RepID=A0A0F9M895_9ZZZZ
MFIVQDNAVATTIHGFYENPDDIRWRDELTRLNLLDRVEPFANKVQALTLADFIENDRWLGINKEMDQYLPTIIHNRLVYDTNYSSLRGYDYDILRSVSLLAQEPIHNVTIKANDLIWFKGESPGFTELTIDINPGLPKCLLRYNDINITADVTNQKRYNLLQLCCLPIFTKN